MKTVVITGSTRGIGRGLADNFLLRGWNVVINGRNPVTVETAVSQLKGKATSESRVAGRSGSVSSRGDMQALYDFAIEEFRSIDIWVNNAGVGHPYKPVWELSDSHIAPVVEVDFLGIIITSAVAAQGFLAQGHGHIYNMEGFGSNGRIRPGISVYGASKRALRFLSRSMSAELAKTPVSLSRISPGIVATEFLSDQFQEDPLGFMSAKRIFNILGDRVETVTPWLVDKMIGNKKNGALFEWLTGSKVLLRFLSAPFYKRNIFDD